MRVVVLLQRPSRWSRNGLYQLFKSRAKKRHVYSCREIARWAQEEDGKEHSPSWVNAKMWGYYRSGKTGIEPVYDTKGEFVGWKRN